MGFNPRGSEAANRRRGLSPVRARGQRLGFAALALALGLVWAPSAAALTFAFRCPPDCSPREGAGRLLESEFIYDQDSLSFSWTARFAEVDGRLPDGFWMVVSEGRVRNRTEDGLPILYGDAATGRVSAYVYDRERGRDSFEDTAGFIETFANAFSATDEPNGDRTLRVSLNTAGLNSFSQDPEWRGLAFDTSIGIWVHSTFGTVLDFDAAGRVLVFDKIDDSSYDRGNNDTEQITLVPEPGTALLLGLGLLAVSRRR